MPLSDLTFSIKLVIAHIVNRPTRLLLTMLTTILAACIVVWVVSSYDSLTSKFDEFSGSYIGRYDFIIVPTESEPTPGSMPRFDQRARHLDPKLVSSLTSSDQFAAIEPIFQTRAKIEKLGAIRPDLPSTEQTPNAIGRERAEGSGSVRRPGGGAERRGGGDRPGGSGRGGPVSGGFPGGGFGFNRGPTLVGTTATEPPYPMLQGKWMDAQANVMEAVLSADTATEMAITVGDEVSLSGDSIDNKIVLKIVGIIEQRKSLPSPPPIIGLPAMRGPPTFSGPATAALYVPLQLALRAANVDADEQVQYDYAGVVLKPHSDIDNVRSQWTETLLQSSPPASLVSLQDVDDELSRSTANETVRAQSYSATGISLLAAMFIIFSTLSMGVDERIRQFAMLRAVVCTKAQIAVMIFTESLFLGLVGWIGGLFAGWMLLQYMTRSRPDLFPVGASLGLWCIGLSGVCAVGGALIAAIPPAWKATSVRPLEGMSRSTPTSAAWPWKATCVGLFLVLVNPLLVFWIPIPDESRYIASAACGCLCMGIGFIFLAPLAVRLTERIVAPLVAGVFRVNSQLLSTQLSTNHWRTLGATVSLSLGLGLFVATQTWGYSMLAPFTPGDWVPDMLVWTGDKIVSENQEKSICNLPGIVADRSLPCVSEQVLFATDVTGSNLRATSSRQDNCVMVGIDSLRAIGGTDPIFDFHFVVGSRADAMEKMSRGRYCLVPDHFERESGLTIGDTFRVVPFDKPDSSLEYEIAGVVTMPGWHWMSKVGLRNHNGGRSAGLMFAGIEQVRHDFQVDQPNAFWLNTDGSLSEEQVKSSVDDVVSGSLVSGVGREGRGRWNGVNVRSREGVRTAIRERAAGIIWLLSRLPLITLLVTSLGIVNMIVSSLRARQWDHGVMRAIGVTRFGLIRLIICEAILVGIAACLLSLVFGVTAGYCGTGVTRYVNVRGGQIVPLVIPWTQVGIGFAITFALCLVAAIGPAIRTGLKEPLQLLQAGRANAN